MKYYSIRVIEAESIEEAIDKLEDEHFDEDHDLCDRIVPEVDILETFKLYIK